MVLTQTQRSLAARRALVDAALQIIGDEGYRAMTTSRLEEVTGVSRGLIGYHFGSKQGLTEAVIRHVRELFVADILVLQAENELTGLDGVLGLVRGYLGQLDTNPRLSRVMLVLITESFAAQPRLVDGVRELNALLRGSIADQMERARIDGSVRSDVDTVTSSALVAGVLRGLAIQWIADPQGVDLAKTAAEAMSVIQRAFACGQPG